MSNQWEKGSSKPEVMTLEEALGYVLESWEDMKASKDSLERMATPSKPAAYDQPSWAMSPEEMSHEFLDSQYEDTFLDIWGESIPPELKPLVIRRLAEQQRKDVLQLLNRFADLSAIDEETRHFVDAVLNQEPKK